MTRVIDQGDCSIRCLFARTRRSRPGPAATLLLCATLLGGCSTLPPGTDFPRRVSVALPDASQTRLGAQFSQAAQDHGGQSAFRIIPVGVDGFLTRVQMINAAERTLDLQYFIYHGDETGRLITDALARAADRGVRVRVLVDDGATVAGDEQILALDGRPGVEVRVFNPFRYRGHLVVARALEFLLNLSRLDYRMHNKLLVADNTVALIGGRNIGNQYFQMDPESQFADDDVFVAGPVAARLSTTFDDYWNSALAIPAAALKHGVPSARHAPRKSQRAQLATLNSGSIDYVALIQTGEPYAGMISGRLPLVWANAQVICDSPDKKDVVDGTLPGRLMARAVATTTGAVQSELLMITPYFIPADAELKLVDDLGQRHVRVRVLTNSLESNPDPPAHSGYAHYRIPLIQHGIELYEVRSLLGSTRGSGQTREIARFGTYGLHAKLYVFDRRQLFIGSMNYDQRSSRLNTEIGLIIDSPELALQTVARFDAMARPENSYDLSVRTAPGGGRPYLVWSTVEGGQAVEYRREPARSLWQRLKVQVLSWLPLDREL